MTKCMNRDAQTTEVWNRAKFGLEEAKQGVFSLENSGTLQSLPTHQWTIQPRNVHKTTIFLHISGLLRPKKRCEMFEKLPFVQRKNPGDFPPFSGEILSLGEAIRSMGKANLWCLATLFTALLLAASLAIRKTHAKVGEEPGGMVGCDGWR